MRRRDYAQRALNLRIQRTAAGLDEGANKHHPKGDTTPQSIMRVAKAYGKQIGQPDLAPHDLRRTFAKLSRKGGAVL